MFKKILVAIDDSAISDHVFDAGLDLAKITGASLMLFRVLLPEESSFPLIYSPELPAEVLEIYHKQWEEFRKRSLESLRTYTNVAIAAGIRAEFNQKIGFPGQAICDLAQTCGADLIVLGRRGHSGLSELFLGSVSNYVVHHAPCSVLTIQTQALTEDVQNYTAQQGVGEPN